TTYPEPVEHCNVCRWFRECDARRRGDDHLSLVAGIRRLQRRQLAEWNTETMAKLAALPIPLRERPERGSREGIERAREQARVQVEGRTRSALVHEPILPVTSGTGFCRLPVPSAGDVFFDLEGDPFVGEQGLQYLFGMAFRDSRGELRYEKRLTGMHATREDEIDRLLRAGTLIDLHQAFKQGLRASVEEYSLKKLEAFCGFTRRTPLEESRAAMRYVEHRLELGWPEGEEIPDAIRTTLEGYNAEDCFATARLRDWLEEQRAQIARREDVPRPPEKSGDPPEKLRNKLDRTAALRDKLMAGIPGEAAARNEEQS